MKKIWNILFFTIISCLTGELFSGCSDNMDDNGSINADEKVMVRVQFDTRGTGTVAPDPEEINDNESRIKSVRLYAFDGDILDNMVYKTFDNQIGSALVEIEVTKGYRTFYAVINEPDEPEIHSALALANHPNGIKQVQYQIAHYLANDDKIVNILKRSETEDYCLPMYGHLPSVEISTSPAALAMQVDRAVARIDVYMAKAEGVKTAATTENATLDVKAPSQKGYIANENVASTTPGVSYSLDTPVNVTLNECLEDDKSKYTKIYSFYVPEQTCPETSDRLSFTVGGIKWNNTETSYNPFILGNDNDNTGSKPLEKIERNKVYQIFCRMSPSTKGIGLDVSISPWNAVVPQDSILHPGKLGMTNCYIVNPGRSVNIPVINVYKIWNWQFKEPLQANRAVKAELIWEDTQGLITEVTPLLENADYSYSKIQVKTANGKSGNAVVGMWIDGDPDKTYRWSWHIWVPKDQPQAIDLGGMITMDRNLGATVGSYTEEANRINGLLYQWGRKDPFISAATWYGFDDIPLYGSISAITYEEVATDMNLLNAINHPSTFYTSSKHPFDWYTRDEQKQNDTLWGEVKTIYDPCPEGWKVPADMSTWESWTPTNFVWQRNLKGRVYLDASYYPTSGQRDMSVGELTGIGSTGYYWGTNLRILSFYDKKVSVDSEPNRAYGYSVRCVKE